MVAESAELRNIPVAELLVVSWTVAPVVIGAPPFVWASAVMIPVETPVGVVYAADVITKFVLPAAWAAGAMNDARIRTGMSTRRNLVRV
jgi:hypothetical protein